MLQIAPIKRIVFNHTKVSNFDTMDDYRNYAIDLCNVHIQPTKLGQIKLLLKFDVNNKADSIRVFYFRHLSAFQSEIIQIGNGVSKVEYVTEQKKDFFGKEPFIVDMIGFSPVNNLLTEDIGFKVEVSKIESGFKLFA